MREFIIILSVAIFAYSTGYLSGYIKRTGTENHLVKYIFWLSIAGIAYYNFIIYEVIGIMLMIRLFHDIGWTKGVGIKQLLYIGNTEIIDICWRKVLRLTNTNQGFKSKIVFLVYVIIAFIGVSFIINGKYMTWLN